MIKQHYPCVLKLRLFDGRNYWSEIHGFKTEEEFDKWTYNQTFYGTKIIDHDDFTIDSEIDTPTQFKQIRNEKLD
jgi:hypothetical protein